MWEFKDISKKILGYGSIILDNGKSFVCSNDAELTREVDRVDGGAKVSYTATMSGMFVGGEKPNKGDSVKGMFKNENSDVEVTFEGIFLSPKRIEIKGEFRQDYKHFKNKITSWQEYYKES